MHDSLLCRYDTRRNCSADSFKCDPFGRRICKFSSSGTSIFAYDGDSLIEETNASGAVVARYSQTQNIDEPLAMLRSGATSFYHADGLGSVTSLSNTAGALAQTYAYDSFGKQTSSSGSLMNAFQYTGRESDAETGLYYYRARYYDQNAGRFLSEDPIGFHGGEDFYLYAANKPTLLIDPSGLLAELYCEDVASAQNRTDGGPTKHCFIRIKCIGVDVTLELYGPVNNQAKKADLKSTTSTGIEKRRNTRSTILILPWGAADRSRTMYSRLSNIPPQICLTTTGSDQIAIRSSMESLIWLVAQHLFHLARSGRVGRHRSTTRGEI